MDNNTQTLKNARALIKKGASFRISHKARNRNQYSYPKSAGLPNFNSQYDSAVQANPDKIEIKIYGDNSGPEVIFEITPEKQNPPGLLGSVNLSGFEAFGGVQQVLGSMIQSESLRERNMDLRGTLDRELAKNENLENKVIDLKEKNDELKDRLNKLQNDFDFQKQRFEAEIERTKGNAFSAQKLLEMTGTVVANVAGIDREKMLGFLGFADSEEATETKAIGGQQSTPSKVEYEPVNQSPAQVHREEINNWMKTIIEKNPSGADYVMKKIYDVIMYIAKSPENLETIHSLVR
jgi:hypothetical protein